MECVKRGKGFCYFYCSIFYFGRIKLSWYSSYAVSLFPTVPIFDVLQQKTYLVTPDFFRGAWVGWTENVILTFCVTNWVWMLPLNKCMWKIPNFLRLWTATSLILPSFRKNYCLNNYISHKQLEKRQNEDERMKMALHKGFYYYHVIHFSTLFPLLFKKLEKVSWFFLKK